MTWLIDVMGSTRVCTCARLATFENGCCDKCAHEKPNSPELLNAREIRLAQSRLDSLHERFGDESGEDGTR